MQIAQTARLLGITGSIAKRSSEASKLTRKISEDVSSLLAKKGGIHSGELKDIFKRHVPNVEIKFKPLSKKGYKALFDSKLNKAETAIIGFFMELPFGKTGKIVQENLEDFIHETRHFADYLTNPKFNLRSAGFMADLNDAASVKRFDKYYDFYDNKLYKKVDNYSEFDTEELEKELQKLFQDAPVKEKIDALQNYRQGLLSEKNAYNSEFSISPRLLEIPEKNPVKEFCFDEKIKMLNNLLGFEIGFERELIKEQKKLINKS